jgi:hypothetical protein
MQPTPPGWYWDPGNRPGLYRWWDGRTWHDALSANQRAAAPAPLDLPTPDAAGRVVGGGLAVPLLPEPWAPCPPYPEGLEQVAGQAAEVGRTPRGPYLAAVFVGLLAADRSTGDVDRDGRGLADFLLHTYYPHERAVSELRPGPATIAGGPAWQLVLPLAVDDPALGFTEETFVLALAEREGQAPAALFASLPAAPAVPTAEDVLGSVGRAGT